MLREKRCPLCNTVKLACDFLSSKRKCGVGSYCKDCGAEKSRQWRRENKEKYKEYNRKRYLRNKEYYIEYSKKYYRTTEGHFSAYRSQAKIRGLVFELSFENFTEFIRGSCFYCGDVPEKGLTGIDRLDPTEGYVLSNCVSCCGACNLAKQSLTKSEFLNLVEKIFNHRIASD